MSGFESTTIGASGFVWWSAWLANELVSVVNVDAVRSTALLVVAEVFDLVAAVLVIVLIQRITAAQRARAARPLGAGPPGAGQLA